MSEETLELTPEWRAAEAEYQTAVLVAEKSEDEIGKLRAENTWIKRQSQLRSDFTTAQSAASALAAAHKEVTEKYPMVPKTVLDHIKDPEALLAVAKDFEASMKKAGQSWGKAAGASEEPRRNTRSRDEHVALVNRVNQGDPQALKDYKRWVIDNRIYPHFLDQRAKAGRS